MNKLLAVIDYQNDFVTGSLGFGGAAAIDGGIAHQAQAYLAQGDHVLFTYDTCIWRRGKDARCPFPTAIQKNRAGAFTGKRRSYAVRPVPIIKFTTSASTPLACRRQSLPSWEVSFPI